MKCSQCGKEGALHFYQKVGGSEQAIEQCHCEDIEQCAILTMAKEVGVKK